ncbi:hypothetical protein MTR_6g025770 [Medicago truncatula]|uniref:Uncharacterized protein n=1 Tax=Medicago truncatula TaxID=3880 RepID=A0A072U8T7_MEDTR|nr:hypothetical protein MTR_6g025770 [Medicago truncatula]
MHSTVATIFSQLLLAHKAFGTDPLVTPIPNQRMVSWQHGDEDIIIFNVDGSALNNSRKANYDGLIRKHDGRFLPGFFGSHVLPKGNYCADIITKLGANSNTSSSNIYELETVSKLILPTSTYLRLNGSGNGVQAYPTKVKDILSWPIPKSLNFKRGWKWNPIGSCSRSWVPLWRHSL